MGLKLTGNKAGVQIAVLLIVLAVIGGALGWCSKAEASESLNFSIGKATFGSSLCTFQTMTVGSTVADGKWLAGLHTHGEGSCRDEAVDANVGFSMTRITHLRAWTFGLGMGIWEHGDISVGPNDIQVLSEPRRDNDIQLTASILIRWTPKLTGGKLYVDLPYHFSSGGSSGVNPGKNFLQVGFNIPVKGN